MLLLGHAGITLGTVLLLNRALSESYPPITKQNHVKEHLETSTTLAHVRNLVSKSRILGPVSFTKLIDIRLLLIASLLPDIIDKPIGMYLFRNTFSNGRIFCHTLLFLIFITLAGIYLYKSKAKVWLLVLSFGTLAHLIMDQMWLNPHTLLWPLYGFRFEPEDISEFMLKTLAGLFGDIYVFVPEIVGGAVLIWFGRTLLANGKVDDFIRSGRVL